MVCKPARKFLDFPKPPSIYGQVEDAIIEYKRTRKDFIRVMGADVPLWGHINTSMDVYLADAAIEGWNYYPQNTDWPSQYLEAVSNFEKGLRGVEFNPKDIIPLPGSASGYHLLLNAMFEQGDEAVVIEPSHCAGVPFSFMWYLGAKLIQVTSFEDEGWEPDLDMLRESINDKTKAIFMDYPNNPTGAIYSEKARKAIVDIAGENDIPILSDEIYGTIIFDGNEAPSIASISGDVPVMVLSSFSKFFAHPGWRIGYLCFHDPEEKIKELTDTCKRLANFYGHTSRSIPLPITVAATRILREYTSAILDVTTRPLVVKGAVAQTKEMLRKLQASRDYLVKRISELDGVSAVKPKGTMYMFPKVEEIGGTWKTDEEFMVKLAKEEGLAFDFGIPRFGNTSFGHFRTMLMPDLAMHEEMWNRLERFLRKHTK